MNESEPNATPEPPLSELRPMAYRLFLAGIGLYAVTRERLSALTSDWMARAEALEAERFARLEEKLHGRVVETVPTPDAHADDAESHNALDRALRRTNLPTRQDVQALNTRLDGLLDQLDEITTNQPPN
ncbi:MAG: phasin family protein [Anaerolineales bacterium]|nr:phasin family protein [Anaerolineales bacterium]